MTAVAKLADGGAGRPGQGLLLPERRFLQEGGAGPEHICRMTMYFVNKNEYLSRLAEVGAVYRDIIGKNYPAMAAVQVVALMEDSAKVEIETTAVVPV